MGALALIVSPVSAWGHCDHGGRYYERECRERTWDKVARWGGVGLALWDMWERSQASRPVAVAPAWEGGVDEVPRARGYEFEYDRGAPPPPVEPMIPPSRYFELEGEMEEVRRSRDEAVSALAEAEREMGELRWEREREDARRRMEVIELNRRLREANVRLEEAWAARPGAGREEREAYAARVGELEREREEMERQHAARVAAMEEGFIERRSLETEEDVVALRAELERAQAEAAELREDLGAREAEVARLKQSPGREVLERESGVVTEAREEVVSLDDGEIPYATPVPGRPGIVYSPFGEKQFLPIDVAGLEAGSLAKDPHTGKVFRVP